MNTSTAYNIGSDIAANILANNSAQDIINSMEDMESLQEYYGECLENYKCHSPFEITAKDFNDQDDSCELWDAFETGYFETIEKNIDTIRKECLDVLTDMMQGVLDELEENSVEHYEDLLLDCNGMISIGSLEYDPAMVLKRIDPIAYREGYLDFINCIAIDSDELEALEEIKDKINAS